MIERGPFFIRVYDEGEGGEPIIRLESDFQKPD